MFKSSLSLFKTLNYTNSYYSYIEIESSLPEAQPRSLRIIESDDDGPPEFTGPNLFYNREGRQCSNPLRAAAGRRSPAGFQDGYTSDDGANDDGRDDRHASRSSETGERAATRNVREELLRRLGCEGVLERRRSQGCRCGGDAACGARPLRPLPNKRLKLAGGDRSRGSGVLCADAHELSFNYPAPGGRVARSLSASR